MKQRILICLTLAALMLMGLCSAAFAAQDPIDITMDLSANRFSGPAEVTVAIRVTNSSDKDMPGPLALYYPDGARISEFGTPTLAAGASATWTGTWMVTADQLAAGKLTFAVRYPILDESGTLINKTQPFYHAIVDAGSVAQVEINRYISPTMAKKGQEVSVIYEVLNVGTIDVTDVVIKESSTISKSNGKIALVKAGEKATFTFTVTMGTRNLTSNANITYQAGGKTYTDAKPDEVIKYGNVKLDATLKADKKGGNPGETVKLTLTLKNTGKSDYENVTVTDAALGTVFTGLTVKAGETVTQEKEITISQTAEYQFTVSGSDASGATVETATGRIAVTAVDPAKAVALSVQAEVDTPTIYILPDIVKFTVAVTNVGEVEARDVVVHASGVDLYTFDVIQPGQTRSFVRDVRIETPGQFRFDARVSDQLDQRVDFEGNVIRITHAAPTATPSQVPIATPARPQLEEIPMTDDLPPYYDYVQMGLKYGFFALLGLTGLCAVLIVVGAIGRIGKAAKSGKAQDHLTRDGYRDYTAAVPARKRHTMPEEDEGSRKKSAKKAAKEAAKHAEEEAVKDAEATVQAEAAAEAVAAEAEVAVEDAMTQLYPEAAKAEEPAAQPEGEATYRRRRSSSEEE